MDSHHLAILAIIAAIILVLGGLYLKHRRSKRRDRHGRWR